MMAHQFLQLGDTAINLCHVCHVTFADGSARVEMDSGACKTFTGSDVDTLKKALTECCEPHRPEAGPPPDYFGADTGEGAI